MNTQETINRLRKTIDATNGRTFSATFRKRTDGKQREMNARIDVKKHLNPHARPTRPRKEVDVKHNQYTVFDLQKQAYRTISLEELTKITVDGETFEV